MRFFKILFILALLAIYFDGYVRGSSSSSSSSSSNSFSESGTASRPDSGSSSRIVPKNAFLNKVKVKDRSYNPQATQVPTSNVMTKEELFQHKRMLKKERNRKYDQKRLAIDPNFTRDSSRRFKERHKDDIEWNKKQKKYNKEYKKKNHQRILQTQREYRAKNSAKLRTEQAIRRNRFKEAHGLKSCKGKRKSQDAVDQPDQKRKKIESSHDEVNASKEHPQQPRRNIVRLKLSPETIKKYFPQSSIEKDEP